jgi:hypothetical protein
MIRGSNCRFIAVPDIVAALDRLRNPLRLVATLRD